MPGSEGAGPTSGVRLAAAAVVVEKLTAVAAIVGQGNTTRMGALGIVLTVAAAVVVEQMARHAGVRLGGLVRRCPVVDSPRGRKVNHDQFALGRLKDGVVGIHVIEIADHCCRVGLVLDCC